MENPDRGVSVEKRIMRKGVVCALVLPLALVLNSAEPTVVRFRESDATFSNPGRGFMTRQRAPGQSPLRFPLSVAYIRVNWADLEPEEGKYEWKVFDDPIEAWKPHGARIAIRIMTTNAHSRGYYASPKWLFDAGCKSYEYLRGGEDPTSGGVRIPRVEPDYADPIYLAKHGNFLRALGQRYDGHPQVEFLDIGSYGIWGEWHTSHSAAVDVRRKIIDMYVDAFHRTPLVFMSDDADGLDYALSKGTGFRRDGVGSLSHERTWMGSSKYARVQGFETAWQRAPVVFEWFGDWQYLKKRDWPFDRSVKFMLDNHVTFINDNIGQVPDTDMPLMADLARRAGYRFVLSELSHALRVRRGATLTLGMRWSNVGVGKLYREYPIELFLLDEQGEVVHRVRATADPRRWLPGEHEVQERIAIPAKLRPGSYVLGLALTDREGKPAIRLAIDAPERELVYRLSRVNVD